MQMIEAVRRVLSNYVTFSGRAARPEYWWWALAVFLGSGVFYLLDMALFAPVPDAAGVEGGPVQIFSGLFGLAVVLPMLAVAARRLHDTDRSAKWLLIGLVPLIGGLVLLWFYVQRGTEGPNRFGPPAPPL